jgi:hypothetical protein
VLLSIETARPDFSDRPFQLLANMKTGSYGLANPSLFYAQKLSNRFSLSAYADIYGQTVLSFQNVEWE